jgi:uncharacterized protein (TIGR02391 family)
VDSDWARERLAKYLELHRACRDAVPPGDYWNERAEAFNDEATELLPTVTRILQALGAPPEVPLLPPSYASAPTDRLVREGLGILRDREEWALRLAPDEPDSPVLAADSFHPWVWRAASPFWEAGQTAAAVEYAAKSLTAHVQQKSGSRLADRELAADVFSSKPHAVNPRLWLPGERDGDTWRSRQDGLHHLAIGAYAGIRNVAAHAVEPGWSDQEALEYLAVLSTVARWADETDVVLPTRSAERVAK